MKYYCYLRNIFTFLVFIFLFQSINAQSSTELHPKTLQFANEVYLTNPEYVNDELLHLYDELVRRVEVLEYQDNQLNDIRILTSVGLKDKYNPSLAYDIVNFNPENFNPLKYFFNFSSSEDQYFRVNNTNYVIHILPK